MWEVPQTGLESRGFPDLAGELEERHGLRVTPGALLVRARHAITFRRIRVEGYSAALRAPAPRDPERFRWVRAEDLKALPVSSLTRKLVRGWAAGQIPLAL
jgi:hypothetical protein